MSRTRKYSTPKALEAEIKARLDIRPEHFPNKSEFGRALGIIGMIATEEWKVSGRVQDGVDLACHAVWRAQTLLGIES